MLTRLSHIMIYSRSHAESVLWYCEKLGFEVVFNAPGIYAVLNHDRLGRIAIHATSTNDEIGKGPVPYLCCDDIHSTVSDLRALGITASDPKREGESPWFADFTDLDGNRWGIEEG